jgi:hypothetical protein
MSEERVGIRLEFTGVESMFVEIMYMKFKEVDPTITRSKMFMMLYYEYLNFVLDRKVNDSLIDNIVKEAHNLRTSGALKESILAIREANKLARGSRYRKVSIKDQELIALGQEQFEREFLKNKEETDGEGNKSSGDSFLSNRETLTGDVSAFFID